MLKATTDDDGTIMYECMMDRRRTRRSAYDISTPEMFVIGPDSPVALQAANNSLLHQATQCFIKPGGYPGPSVPVNTGQAIAIFLS